MGRVARQNADEYLIHITERRLEGKPICTCPPYWFSRHSRHRLRMMKQEDLVKEGASHEKGCEMVIWFEEGGPVS